jgi:hypothetical protein
MATRVVGVARGSQRSIARSAARGAGLIGAAVIVGIILLQVVDDGSTGTSGNGGGGGGSTDTPVTDETTQTTNADTRPPAQVRVLVLNAGQAAGSAQNKANDLRLAGYNTLPASNDPVGRQGVAVQCREDFEDEGAALALAVGEGATTEPFPAQPPEGSENADCLVLLGQV